MYVGSLPIYPIYLFGCQSEANIGLPIRPYLVWPCTKAPCLLSMLALIAQSVRGDRGKVFIVTLRMGGPSIWAGVVGSSNGRAPASKTADTVLVTFCLLRPQIFSIFCIHTEINKVLESTIYQQPFRQIAELFSLLGTAVANNSIGLTAVIQRHRHLADLTMLKSRTEYQAVFEQYANYVCDFVTIGGFTHMGKVGR